MRELDAEDLKAIDNAHVKLGEQIVQSMIKGIITVGGTNNSLLELLESVNAAIMVYLSYHVEEFDVDMLTTLLQANTAARVRWALNNGVHGNA